MKYLSRVARQMFGAELRKLHLLSFVIFAAARTCHCSTWIVTATAWKRRNNRLFPIESRTVSVPNPLLAPFDRVTSRHPSRCKNSSATCSDRGDERVIGGHT
jgi:hypothetical protein